MPGVLRVGEEEARGTGRRKGQEVQGGEERLTADGMVETAQGETRRVLRLPLGNRFPAA
jgi:hypothetical protein